MRCVPEAGRRCRRESARAEALDFLHKACQIVLQRLAFRTARLQAAVLGTNEIVFYSPVSQFDLGDAKTLNSVRI